MKLKNELKKSTNTAIVAAFSFVIGLAWNDVITTAVKNITQISPFQGKLITAIAITTIGVLGIYFTTKMFSKK